MFQEKRVLIVEDDVEISELLNVILKRIGIAAVQAYSGTEAILRLENNTYDLILLDLMLPGIDGETLIQQVRVKSTVPIIVISAKVAVEHKVTMLKNGADDYMTKPFNQEEVLARVEVQLRKSTPIKTTQLQWRGLQVDEDKRVILLEGSALSLTNAEYDILALLMRQPEYAFTKRKLYEQLWTGPYVGDDNTISVHVSNLRKKIATVTNEEYIKTIWGIGFMLV